MNMSRATQRGWIQTHSATLVEAFRLVDAAWILAGLWLAEQLEGRLTDRDTALAWVKVRV